MRRATPFAGWSRRARSAPPSDVSRLRITSAYPKKNCLGDLFAFCEVNLTLAKQFSVMGKDDAFEVAVDVLNAFNSKNYAGFDEFMSATDPLNPADGTNATRVITLPRRIQFRAGYRF